MTPKKTGKEIWKKILLNHGNMIANTMLNEESSRAMKSTGSMSQWASLCKGCHACGNWNSHSEEKLERGEATNIWSSGEIWRQTRLHWRSALSGSIRWGRRLYLLGDCKMRRRMSSGTLGLFRWTNGLSRTTRYYYHSTKFIVHTEPKSYDKPYSMNSRYVANSQPLDPTYRFLRRYPFFINFPILFLASNHLYAQGFRVECSPRVFVAGCVT